ncbi:FAD-dependent oxidoreductase [Rhodococcus jostii]|uniref:ferredoxin--NADP(+) reductase n=1 Tax=Rhodococcus jostii TaxID=132919 RepID=A0A1H4JJV1_RHOJO|nr:FAD-dependent oxidoreductase [Rhodococcus jostii]SEB46523.1 ferredoxin--NADP+ reductase [Rhodococcus jostii]
MTYVITQACCNDASCVSVCPVDCIHPTPDEAPFMRTEMLYIDPDTCIDCSQCVYACPVDAIRPDDDLDDAMMPFLEINAAYYEKYPIEPGTAVPRRSAKRDFDYSSLRVAVVGSGPAASYAALELLARPGVQVDMFERLLTPYGLIRFGVAPDHPGTKAVTDVFQSLGSEPGFRLHLGVEVGKHLSHEELLAHNHAVIYAVGAPGDRRLGVPGEDLPGSHAATEFVAWYNGHPDFVDRRFDLSCERAVIVGNGNVALDVARILVTDPDELEKTDMADHAIAALRKSNIREVVVLGRRGPAQAAYTNPEFLALTNLADVDVVIDPAEAELDEHSIRLIESGAVEPSVRIKAELAERVAGTQATGAAKRIVFRYLESPVEVVGDEQQVTGLTIVRNVLNEGPDGSLLATPGDQTELIEAGLVLRSIGYRGSSTVDVPFDEVRGVIPNDEGRVLEPSTGAPVPGVYTAGWIKRGPSGVIGTNKKCAADTVERLIDDFENGKLTAPKSGAHELERLVAERNPDVVDFAGWTRIDQAEIASGDSRGRTRVKLVDVESMLAVVRS